MTAPRKCKDIPDLPILQFIESFKGLPCHFNGRDISERSVLWAMPEKTPRKLALAKMNMLVRRKLVEGCTCGCIGLFEITGLGLQHIAASENRKYPLSDQDDT